MARQKVPVNHSRRISIFNLDAVEQSRLWLQQGPVRANTTLLGVLRTALLFGGTVVVDRNQLLEGIFFIAMPPDRLAWHLGLEPGAKLPIEVQLLGKPAPGSKHGDLSDEIEANYTALTQDETRVSSPLIALTGGSYESGSGVTPREPHSASAAKRLSAWYESDHVVLPQQEWDKEDLATALEVREKGRLAWVDAMRTGRVAVRSGKSLGPNPLGQELSAELPPNPQGLAAVDDLTDALINLEYADQTDRDRTVACGAMHPGDQAPCTRAHVTTRSLVVRWLDGERLDNVTPPVLPAHLHDPQLADLRSSALSWWTLAYYRATSERDGLRLLTLFQALSASATEQDTGGMAQSSAERAAKQAAWDAEVAWGLRRPPRSALAQLFTHTRRLKRSATTSTLPIGGDVVSRLASFTPSQYSRLRSFEAVTSGKLLESPGRRSLFDLVMAIDEVVGDTTSRARRMRATAFRAAVFMVVAVALVLYENGYLEISGVWGPIIAVTAAALLSAPWSDVGALRRMSGSKMQSTLRFHHDGN